MFRGLASWLFPVRLSQYDLQPGGPFSDRCLASLYLFRDLRHLHLTKLGFEGGSEQKISKTFRNARGSRPFST
jgi:hypothetical protein